MYRFLLGPKWIAGLLGILLAAASMISLGNWQLDRMHQKRAANAAITAAIEADPVSPDGLIPGDASTNPDDDAMWRKVIVTGTYAPEDTILVRQRTFSDGNGFEVLVPLVADDGHTYLISRGYVLSNGAADDVPDLPDPPTGAVTVTGWVRPGVSGADHAATQVDLIGGVRSVRSIDTSVLQDNLDTSLAGGYIQATDESADAASITRVPLPELDDGPHLSYAIQWFIFATIAVVGFIYLARREAYDRLLADEDLDDQFDDGPDQTPETLVPQGVGDR